MQVEPLSQQIEFACFLMVALIIFAYMPSNSEIAARFRAWKAARAARKNAERRTRENAARWMRMQ
jgi:hypothetical protein